MMADVKFTKAQASAVYAPTGNLLVSAAAGSGKTAVLTQRVIEMLTGSDPVSADSIAVVTFSNASAAEMKQRIQKKMRALIATDPENSRLQTQLTMLSKAKISTIHSLCGELIKENFQVLDIPVNYRMAEENEIKIMKVQVLEEVIDEFYDSKNPDFLALTDYFTVKDDSALFNIVSSTYNFISSFPFYTEMLDNFLAPYKSDATMGNSIWVKALIPDIKGKLAMVHSLLSSIEGDILGDDILSQKYGPAFENDLDTTKLLLARIREGDFARCAEIFSTYRKLSLKAATKYENKEHLEHIKSVRTQATKHLEALKKEYFSLTEADYEEDIQILTPIITKMCEVVKAYDRRFLQRKKQNNILDFSDLEHFALELLVAREGKFYVKTPTAIKLAETFEEIMIDECQDINTVQNLIFWGLSKSSERIENDFNLIQKDSKNLFMVGDVKQSIYRFRNAMPTLFIAKSVMSKNYNENSYKKGDMAKIILQNNFRSSSYVTDFVNLIFSQIMSENFGEINYNEDEYLIASLPMPDNPQATTKVHILDLPTGEEKKEAGALKAEEYEALHIASIVEDMITRGHKVAENGSLRKCKPGDFCILLRSKKNKSVIYMNALKNKGFDCFSDASEGYFGSFEISVVLDLLRIIDNPLQDIPLFSVMLSPMFMFTADDIAKIRIVDKTVPLYVALTMSAELYGDTKCQDFIASLEHLRRQSLVVSTHKLIEMIYDSTGFINIAESMVAGEERRANLRLLLTYAQGYENIGYKGVSGFIRYVDNAIERKEDFSCANVLPQNSNAVKIMTIHSSKGLEFPICILANAAKSPNLMDLNKPYQFNPDLGIGMKITKPTEYKNYSSLPYEAIKYVAKKEILSEEMRTMYVALTRPQNELIVVGGLTEAEKIISEITLAIALSEKDDISLPLMKYNSYLEWILCAFAQKQKFDKNFKLSEQIEIFPATTADEPLSVARKQASPDENLLAKITENLAFEYEYKSLSQIPAKITVTQIAKASQDLFATDLPELYIDDPNEITGAMRGNALHSFMQYASYALAEKNLEDEIARLIEHNFLSEQEAKLLNKAKIKGFFTSDLYARIKKSHAVYREYEFIYEMDAGTIYPHLEDKFQDEKIVVQGIADTVFIDEHGAVIVDYKTDIAEDEQILIERYQTQLLIYKDALNSHFDGGVSECYIYSLHLKKAIKISV